MLSLGALSLAHAATKGNQPVDLTRLVTGLGRPDYAPMPDRQAPLPMPARARIRRG